ncbi:MAG TPA: hypothetical protein VIY51_06590 [Xanthobacteraceae bacterium]
MRPSPGLGLTNFALVSAYFVPAWGHAALRVLTSPYSGLEDRAHSVTAIYFRDLFDFGLAGLIRTSELLAGLKMVIAAAFVAYLIEFARALATGREPNRETVDVVLLLALTVCGLWIVPTLRLGDAGLIRLQATEFLLLIGAAIVIMVERQIERAVAPATQARMLGEPAPNLLDQAALVTLPAVHAALP